MEYDRLTDEELNDFISRVVVQLEPKLTQQVLSITTELLEYRNKIEQGTLIELPCKVGDTVYRIRKKPYKAVLERFVVSITLCLNYKGQFEWRLFTTTEDTLGKSVFLTREEAEAKLK